MNIKTLKRLSKQTANAFPELVGKYIMNRLTEKEKLEFWICVSDLVFYQSLTFRKRCRTIGNKPVAAIPLSHLYDNPEQYRHEIRMSLFFSWLDELKRKDTSYISNLSGYIFTVWRIRQSNIEMVVEMKMLNIKENKENFNFTSRVRNCQISEFLFAKRALKESSDDFEKAKQYILECPSLTPAAKQKRIDRLIEYYNAKLPTYHDNFENSFN